MDQQGGLLNGGMPINEVIQAVDEAANVKPVEYLSNCSWETQVELMYAKAEEHDVLHRLKGFYNNASNINHDDKQNLDAVQRYDSIEDYIKWVKKMLKRFPHLKTEDDIWITGCCGFGADEIDQLIRAVK